MSDEEEDYLSEKFLAGIAAQSSSGSKTYSQRRREAQHQAEIRNLAGRARSKKEIERENLEALKEGMGTSLFEREKLGQVGGPSKAMNMMAKMGFKPGQTLGQQRDTISSTENGDMLSKKGDRIISGLKAPISVNIWEGRKGLGAMKRPLSPTTAQETAERAKKIAKVADDSEKQDFRTRSRVEYEEKRDAGRFSSARKTCSTLDEKAGVEFNVLTLDPNQPWKFPPGLQQKLDLEIPDTIDDTFHSRPPGSRHRVRRDNLERLLDEENDERDGGEVMLKIRLRDQMKKDALEPLEGNDLDDDGPILLGGAIRNDGKSKPGVAADTEEDIEITDEMLPEVKEWLNLDVATRLQRLLAHMRGKYSYCFWCGTEYQDVDDLKKSCPGETEEEHD